MDDAAPPPPYPRRPRIGVVAVAITVAIVVGLGLMLWAARTSGGLFRTPAPATSPLPAASAAPAAVPAPVVANPAAAAIDPVTLATREAALAGQLASLEARTAGVSVTAQAAAGQAGRAEAVLVAFAARRALDRGAPLGFLEEQLRQRFGAVQPRATFAIIQASRQPVTLEWLREQLDAAAPRLLDGEGWFGGLGRELASLVIVHRAGTPSPLPAERLARARRLLAAGQVEPALAEVQRLPGAASFGGWGQAARRYLDARRALDMIETSALMGEAAPAVTLPAAPVAAPAR